MKNINRNINIKKVSILCPYCNKYKFVYPEEKYCYSCKKKQKERNKLLEKQKNIFYNTIRKAKKTRKLSGNQ